MLSLITCCSAIAAEDLSEEAAVKKIKYTSQHLRDPFRSPFETGVSFEADKGRQNLPKFKVQGLVWDSPVPQVIINDTVFLKGQVVQDAEILEIGKEGVSLLYGEKTYLLKPEVSIKRK